VTGPVGAPDRATLTAFMGAVLIGGNNFIAVKFSNEELEPMYGASLRFAAATLLFLAIARLRKLPLPRGHAAFGASLYGLLGFGVSYAFLYYALTGLSAGTSSVIVASVPLMTLVLAVVHRQERFSTRGVIGGLLAIGGIGLISADTIGGNLRPIYLVAALFGAMAIAESSVVIKGFPRFDPVTTNAIGMGVGTIFLVIASLAFGEEWIVPQAGKTWLSLAWLVVAGSVGLFMLYLYVIARWTASATNYAVTMMPVVAVTVGILIADEVFSWGVVAGGALVIAAVYVGALSGARAPQPTASPESVVVASETAPETSR